MCALYSGSSGLSVAASSSSSYPPHSQTQTQTQPQPQPHLEAQHHLQRLAQALKLCGSQDTLDQGLFSLQQALESCGPYEDPCFPNLLHATVDMLGQEVQRHTASLWMRQAVVRLVGDVCTSYSPYLSDTQVTRLFRVVFERMKDTERDMAKACVEVAQVFVQHCCVEFEATGLYSAVVPLLKTLKGSMLSESFLANCANAAGRMVHTGRSLLLRHYRTNQEIEGLIPASAGNDALSRSCMHAFSKLLFGILKSGTSKSYHLEVMRSLSVASLDLMEVHVNYPDTNSVLMVADPFFPLMHDWIEVCSDEIQGAISWKSRKAAVQFLASCARHLGPHLRVVMSASQHRIADELASPRSPRSPRFRPDRKITSPLVGGPDGSSEGTSLVVSPQLVAQAKVLKQAAVSGLQKARRDKMKAVREAAEQALAIFSMEIRGSGESIESLTPRENRRASSSASSTVSAGVPDTSSAHRGGSNTGRQQGWTDGSRRSPDIQLASPEQIGGALMNRRSQYPAGAQYTSYRDSLSPGNSINTSLTSITERGHSKHVSEGVPPHHTDVTSEEDDDADDGVFDALSEESGSSQGDQKASAGLQHHLHHSQEDMERGRRADSSRPVALVPPVNLAALREEGSETNFHPDPELDSSSGVQDFPSPGRLVQIAQSSPELQSSFAPQRKAVKRSSKQSRDLKSPRSTGSSTKSSHAGLTTVSTANLAEAINSSRGSRSAVTQEQFRVLASQVLQMHEHMNMFERSVSAFMANTQQTFTSLRARVDNLEAGVRQLASGRREIQSMGSPGPQDLLSPGRSHAGGSTTLSVPSGLSPRHSGNSSMSQSPLLSPREEELDRLRRNLAANAPIQSGGSSSNSISSSHPRQAGGRFRVFSASMLQGSKGDWEKMCTLAERGEFQKALQLAMEQKDDLIVARLLRKIGSKGLWHAKDAEIEKLVHRLLRWLGDDASLMDDSLQSFSDLLTAHSTSLSPSLLPLLHATLTDRYMQLELDHRHSQGGGGAQGTVEHRRRLMRIKSLVATVHAVMAHQQYRDGGAGVSTGDSSVLDPSLDEFNEEEQEVEHQQQQQQQRVQQQREESSLEEGEDESEEKDEEISLPQPALPGGEEGADPIEEEEQAT